MYTKNIRNTKNFSKTLVKQQKICYYCIVNKREKKERKN